jgi:hypothetical protein
MNIRQNARNEYFKNIYFVLMKSLVRPPPQKKSKNIPLLSPSPLIQNKFSPASRKANRSVITQAPGLNLGRDITFLRFSWLFSYFPYTLNVCRDPSFLITLQSYWRSFHSGKSGRGSKLTTHLHMVQGVEN